MSADDIIQVYGAVELAERAVPYRIGLIALATDHTSERDFARICDPNRVGVYVNRVFNENPTTPENLRRMEPRLRAAAAEILPDEDLDAIYYGCTSASVVIGDVAVEAAIHAAKPGVPVITPSGAACAGRQALGLRRISILTPYLPETSAPFIAYFQSRGFEVLNLTCLGMEDDRDMARVKPSAIAAAARETAAPEAEALFISCTALRAAEVAGEIEAAIGRPVVTSNQAGAWLSLRRDGFGDAIGGDGRLLTLPAPQTLRPAASA